MTDDAQKQIAVLERDKRWWKSLAIGFMSVLAFIVIASGFSFVVLTMRARAEAQRAEAEARRAEMAIRERVEQADHAAQKPK
jgi:sensor domain CHASE-containing protein